ncbi:MAG: hypothetical protein IT330_00390 [Anaerolineae bacterium]|nr:hypothetical protein [Anaerolineae bacterium]
MEERILTKHPQGKRGVHISKQRYDVVREAIHTYPDGNPIRPLPTSNTF